MGLFGSSGGLLSGSYFNRDKPKFTFRPVAFDMNILSNALYAKQLQAAVPSFKANNPSKLPSARDPAIIAPWEIPTESRSLASRIAEVRALDKFVSTDPRLDHIKLANHDPTSENLFALYQGLESLRTLALYASEEKTPLSSLGRLDDQFQRGYTEVQEFLPTAEFNKLDIFFGKKDDDVTTVAGIGKNSASFTGGIIQTGAADDPLAGITGTEQFIIRATNTATSAVTDVTIDLSQIVGTISINAVVNHINTQLAAAGTVQSTFSVKLDENYDYGIAMQGSSLEEIRFIAVNPEPALYVASNFDSASSETDVGTLTKIIDAEGTTPLRQSSTTIGGVDLGETTVAIETAKAEAIEEEKLDEFDEADVDPIYAETSTSGIAVDSEGFIYVVGQTSGAMGSQISGASEHDVFLNKMDSEGNIVYSRLLGAAGSANAFSIIVDANDNVIIAGQTDQSLVSTDYLDGKDAFVTKYDNRGEEIFTYQLDSVAESVATSIAVDASGDIIVGGFTSGAISSTSGFGGVRDGLILKLDGTDGSLLNSSLIGGTGYEKVKTVAVASDGDILITTVEDDVAYLKKLSASDLSTEVFSMTLGSMNSGEISDIHVEGSAIYVTGYTTNAAFDVGGSATIINAHGGSTDGFVLRIDDAGSSATANYLTYVGGTGADKINDVTYANGNLYVAGESSGSVNGETAKGLIDSFVSSIDAATGSVNYTNQFGVPSGSSQGTGVAFVSSGTSVLQALGLPTGTIQQRQTRELTTQTSLRDGDHFYISINGGARRKIEIDAGSGVLTGDDYSDLIRKIKAVSFSSIKAEEKSGTDGPYLSIRAINGATIELSSGKDGQDALSKLGLEPQKLLSSELLFKIDSDPNKLNDDDLGGVFGLDLLEGIHLRDKTSAKFALSKIENAISTIQRAYRSLVITETDYELHAQKRLQGTAPAYLTAKLANFQDALNRLQGASQASSTGFFI